MTKGSEDRRLERMLLVGADLSVEDVFDYTSKLGGVAIPAHVDRTSYSIISNLRAYLKTLMLITLKYQGLLRKRV